MHKLHFGFNNYSQMVDDDVEMPSGIRLSSKTCFRSDAH